MDYQSPDKVADFLSRFQFQIVSESKGTFSPAHVKYRVALSKDGKDFSTTFESNPQVHGKPTITQVFAALTSDAQMAQSMSLDEFADEFGADMKPSQVIRAYRACEETNHYLRDDLYLSYGELNALANTLSESQDEVEEATTLAVNQRAARLAFEEPPVPKGFVTIKSLTEDLNLGSFGDQIDYFDGDLDDLLHDTADSNVDINYHDLLAWLPDHTEWLEEADASGLLEGCKGDIYRMVQMAQYECFTQELYSCKEDICKYGTLMQLEEAGVYAIEASLAEDLLSDLDFDGSYVPTDDAKEAIQSAFCAALNETQEDAVADLLSDALDGDSYDYVNPCAMSASAVREVNAKGYDAAFLASWEELLSDNELSLADVSLKKESRDMQEGKDALSTSPEKDAPSLAEEKPPVETEDTRS